MKNKERKLFSLFDILIILLVAVISVVSLLSQIKSSDSNLLCVIRVDGEVVHTVKLSDFTYTQHDYKIDSEYPLTVVVSHDSVFVESASCPDKLCEHTGVITRSGQSIVCLPARVSVTLVSSENDFDAVVG